MQSQSFFRSDSTTNGFTLLEVLITVILIGILFAIAAPNWVAFINQQRVGSARSQVAQAIRTAQSQAQQTKVNRAVVFDNNNGQPRYAIVAAANNSVDIDQITNWQTLGDGSIQPGIIRLWGDQGTDRNRATLIFDGYGAIVASSVPYAITIGAAIGVNPRRCVSVETLLGATAENSDAACPAAP
ncbi:prepilin-type N-terminal cleavage/methylation domain-containing protein [Leptolyngbya sp. FACHB-17]|uniref:pilus assembly FimT family protein n=1 Tax=unclassified Leptolyngbya TaxID=2650499 RepID=UPI0016800214|nr:prepilin-type N-terminal cleavage/methylation domain-containing protein [Leptolyngbya sp. FACHB-17]MBD2082350.1 prepilin-type N-terminal cleavage/methylation domain-containing protein [Leptolyngbya sp. FACHB-17]